MLDRTVNPKVFVVTISSAVVVVVLTLLVLSLVRSESPQLETTIQQEDQAEESSSSSLDNTTSSDTTAQQVTSSTAASSTSTSVSTTEKPLPSSTSVMTVPSETQGKREVVFIGDSLLHQTDAPKKLVPKLVRSGWQKISIDAQGCRPNHVSVNGCQTATSFAEVLRHIDTRSYDIYTTGAFSPQVNQESLKTQFANDQSLLSGISDTSLNESFRQADVLVVALGTNDNEDVQQMETGVRQTIVAVKKINPTIDIYWVKICPHGGKKYSGSIFNPLLEKLSQEVGFKLIDWASVCQPGYQHDGIHYTEAGAEAYTDTLVSGIS